MSDYLEAIVLLLPPEAGGRFTGIAPREGSYRPRLGRERLQSCFIEGPPSLEPGHAALVVMEIEPPADRSRLTAGAEFEIFEDERMIGVLTVTRFWRSAVAV